MTSSRFQPLPTARSQAVKNLVVHFLLGGIRQQGQSVNSLCPFFCVQMREHGLDPVRIEDRFRLLDSCARRRNPQVDASAVDRIAGAFHITPTHEAIDRNRHRGHCDAHVFGEFHQARRLCVVEMVQDAGLMRADDPSGLGIMNVSRMASEENLRVELHDLLRGTSRHLTKIIVK